MTITHPNWYTKTIKNKDVVSVYKGYNISVEFDSPRALQIDGETNKNALSYIVIKQLQRQNFPLVLRKEFFISFTIIKRGVISFTSAATAKVIIFALVAFIFFFK